MNRRNSRKLYYGILGVVFVVMLVLNILSPMIADDYNYSFQAITGMKNQSVMDIVNSMIYQYESWGGRIFAHTLASVFLMLPPIVFDVCNSIIFVLLGHFIYRFIVIEEQWKFELILLIYMTLFLCIPVFGQTVVWLIGACNYLWTLTVMVGFLVPYRNYCSAGKTLQPWAIIPFVVIAFLAGGSNEHVSAAVLLCAGLLTAYAIYKKQAIKWWTLAGLLLGFSGWLIMVCAPGNYIRLEASTPIVTSRRYILVRYVRAFVEATEHLVDYKWLIFGILLLLVLAWHYKMNKEVIFIAVAMMISALLGHYAMIFVDQYADRAYIGIQVLFVVAGLLLYHNLTIQWSYLVKKAILAWVATQCSFQFIMATASMVTSYVDYIDRERYIAEAIELGDTKVETYAIHSSNPYNVFTLRDIIEDATYWTNVSFAKYHGLESIEANEIRRH